MLSPENIILAFSTVLQDLQTTLWSEQ